jgi:hypothetical protein
MQGLKPQRVEDFGKEATCCAPATGATGNSSVLGMEGLRAVRFFSLYGAIPPMGNEQVGISSA